MPTTLTTLGIFHTVFGVGALICGFIALAQDKQILLKNRYAGGQSDYGQKSQVEL